MTAETVAKAFISGWIARFGCPTDIITDRGRQFESALFKYLSNLAGFQRKRTTTYNPQCNGLVEKNHRQLKTVIKCYENSVWKETLPLVMLGMRCAFKEDLQTSPAELLYGETLRLLGDFFQAGKVAREEAGMLGARLKSWMEAQLGRAKKRKQKQSRPVTTTATGPLPPPHLSSPESAYSTGYSTDGTSPGVPPAPLARAAPLVSPPPPPAPPTTHLYHEPAKRRSSTAIRRCVQEPIIICATPSPRPRCRIRTNPWLGGTSPNVRRRPSPHLIHQQSLQCPQQQPPQLHHAPYSLDSYPVKHSSRSPHLSPEPHRSPHYRGGASSDEECRNYRTRGRETAILSDADLDSDGDTGLDGGDEDEPDETASPGRRRARRRRPPRRPPRSAGATPPRVRRRSHAPSAPPVRERDPLLEADREAERKYRELIREAEKLLVTVARAPLEPPHNPRVRELRATEVEAPRRSPERTHITNFMRANSPEPPRRLSPVARRSPLAAPPPPPPRVMTNPPSPTDRPHSEPPKRKAYARDEVLQTLEGLRKSLQQQSALLAVQRTRLDSL